MARRMIMAMAVVLWGLLLFLTLFVLFTSGPDILVLMSILVVAVLGLGIFGAMGEPRK